MSGMTREEAMQVLKEISTTLKSWSGFTSYPQAIDMAIEALKDRPKYNLEIIADIVRQLGHLDSYVADTCDRPSVVRCKDCRWWNCENLNYQHNNHLCRYWSKFGSIDTSADDFCSLGERREP